MQNGEQNELIRETVKRIKERMERGYGFTIEISLTSGMQPCAKHIINNLKSYSHPTLIFDMSSTDLVLTRLASLAVNGHVYNELIIMITPEKDACILDIIRELLKILRTSRGNFRVLPS